MSSSARSSSLPSDFVPATSPEVVETTPATSPEVVETTPATSPEVVEDDATKAFKSSASAIIRDSIAVHTYKDEKDMPKTDFGAVVRQLLLILVLSLISVLGDNAKVMVICQLQKQSARIATKFFKEEIVEKSVANFMANTGLAFGTTEYRLAEDSLRASMSVFQYELNDGKFHTINGFVPKHKPEVAKDTLKRAMLSFALKYDTNIIELELFNLELRYNDGDDYYVITKLNSSTTLIHHLEIENDICKPDDNTTSYDVRFEIDEEDFDKFKSDVKTLFSKSSIHLHSIKSCTKDIALIGNSSNAVICAMVANMSMSMIKPPVPKGQRDSKSPTVQVVVNGVTFTPVRMIALKISSGVKGDFTGMTFGQVIDKNDKVLVDAYSFLINVFGKSINGLNAYVASYILYLMSTLPYMYNEKSANDAIRMIANGSSNHYGSFNLSTSDLRTGAKISSFSEVSEILSTPPSKLRETGSMVEIEYAHLAPVFSVILAFWENAEIDKMPLMSINYAKVILEFPKKNILRGSTINVLTNMIAFFADILGIQVNKIQEQGSIAANMFLGLVDHPEVVAAVFVQTQDMKDDSVLKENVENFVEKTNQIITAATILQTSRENLVSTLSPKELESLEDRSLRDVQLFVLKKNLSKETCNQLNEVTPDEIFSFALKGLVSTKISKFLGKFFGSIEDLEKFIEEHPKGTYAKKCKIEKIPEPTDSNLGYIDKLIQFKESLRILREHLEATSYTIEPYTKSQNVVDTIKEVFASGAGVDKLRNHGISVTSITPKVKKELPDEIMAWVESYVNEDRFQPLALKTEKDKVEGGKKIKAEGGKGKPALTRHSSSSEAPQQSSEDDDLPPPVPSMVRSNDISPNEDGKPEEP